MIESYCGATTATQIMASREMRSVVVDVGLTLFGIGGFCGPVLVCLLFFWNEVPAVATICEH